MSLTAERLQIEAKIAELERKNAIAALTVDIAITQIRQEASPLLEPEAIELDKIDAAVAMLRDAIESRKQNAQDIIRLQKKL